jgi:hypothetical protein
MSHWGSILLHSLEWVLILSVIAAAVLIQAFAGEGRGERHPGARRRYYFYTSVFVIAICICKLMEPHDALWFLWGILAFAFLGKVVWSVEATRRRQQMQATPFSPRRFWQRQAQ